MPLIMFANDPDCRIGYAWTEEMLKRGVYMHPWHNMFLCAAMTEADIAMTVAVADEAFAVIASRLSSLQPHPLLMAMAETEGAEAA